MKLTAVMSHTHGMVTSFYNLPAAVIYFHRRAHLREVELTDLSNLNMNSLVVWAFLLADHSSLQEEACILSSATANHFDLHLRLKGPGRTLLFSIPNTNEHRSALSFLFEI